jgi:hypothetical protein
MSFSNAQISSINKIPQNSTLSVTSISTSTHTIAVSELVGGILVNTYVPSSMGTTTLTSPTWTTPNATGLTAAFGSAFGVGFTFSTQVVDSSGSAPILSAGSGVTVTQISSGSISLITFVKNSPTAWSVYAS